MMPHVVRANGDGENIVVYKYLSNGDADTSFSSDGHTLTSLTSTNEGATCAAVDAATGKIVVAGYADDLIMVARYNTNGSLDTTFSSDGVQTVDISNSTGEQAEDVVVDSNGRVVVAISSSNAGGTALDGVIRLTSSGSLDTSFSGDGYAWFQITDSCGNGWNETVWVESVAIGSGNSVFLAGAVLPHHCPGEDIDRFALAKFTSSGNLDTGFSGNGWTMTEIAGSTSAKGTAVALDSNGKVYVVGHAQVSGGGNQFAVARYTSTGALDTSYSGDGMLLVNFSGTGEVALAASVDPNDRLVIGGYASSKFAIARTSTSGSLDTGFSSDGLANYDFSGSDFEGVVGLVQHSNSVIAGGWWIDDTSDQIRFAAQKVTASGWLDSNFGGGDGLLTDALGSADIEAKGVADCGSGKFVIVGEVRTQ